MHVKHSKNITLPVCNDEWGFIQAFRVYVLIRHTHTQWVEIEQSRLRLLNVISINFVTFRVKLLIFKEKEKNTLTVEDICTLVAFVSDRPHWNFYRFWTKSLSIEMSIWNVQMYIKNFIDPFITLDEWLNSCHIYTLRIIHSFHFESITTHWLRILLLVYRFSNDFKHFSIHSRQNIKF